MSCKWTQYYFTTSFKWLYLKNSETYLDDHFQDLDVDLVDMCRGLAAFPRCGLRQKKRAVP